MGNLLIAAPLATEADWVITDPTAAATNPGRVITMQPGEAWGDGTASASVLIDTGSAQSVDIVAMIAHTGVASGTWRVRAGTTSSVTGYDSTALTMFPTGFAAADGFDYASSFMRFSPAKSFRWWRIDVSNDGTAFSAGRVYLGTAWQASRNYGYGVQEGLIDGGVIQESLGGHLWPGLERGRRRFFAFNLGFASAADRRAAYALLKRRGVAKDVLVIANPDATEDGQLGMIYGLNTELRAISNPAFGIYDMGFRIEELIR